MSAASIPRSLRLRVAEEAQHRCGYCLTTELLIGAPMEIEHILQIALGGRTERSNLWLACSLCNQHKGVRVIAPDPLTDEFVPLFNPRQQRWSDHFVWSIDYERIIGVTAIGRATTVALQLNRPLLMRSRRIWAATGLHPPGD